MPKRDSQSHCLGVEKLKNSARTFLGITLSVKTGTHQRTHLPRTWGVVALETETKTLTLAHPRVHDHPRNFFRERPRPKSKSVTATVFQRNRIFGPCLENFCRHSDLFKTQNTLEETARRTSEATTFLRFPNLDCWGKISWHTG